jgi:succinoglycan biosynthesis protein ExoU
VHSALRQDHVAQVIVVDDASTDATAERARLADDGTDRLSVIRLSANKGPAAARNRALEACACSHFCVLDADDYMLPGRIAALLAAAPADWDMLADDLVILPEEMTGLEFSLQRNPGAEPARMIDLKTFVLSNLRRPGRPRSELGFLKPIVSLEFLRKRGLRYDEGLTLGEDYALYACALVADARFDLVSACGYVAVEGRNSLSSRHSAAHLRSYYEFDERLLAGSVPLSSSERAALQLHRDDLWREYVFRSALDARRQSGLVAGLSVLAAAPAAVPYVLSETFKAKMKLLPSAAGRDPENGQRRLRFLVGLPGSSLSRASRST